MHVDCCPVIEFKRFRISDFREVESQNSRIQLRNYTFSRVLRLLDGVQPNSGIIFREESYK